MATRVAKRGQLQHLRAPVGRLSISITPKSTNQMRASSASPLEPRPCTAEAETVAPRVHVVTQSPAPDAGDLIRQQDLQITDGVFLGIVAAGVAIQPVRRSGVMQM